MSCSVCPFIFARQGLNCVSYNAIAVIHISYFQGKRGDRPVQTFLLVTVDELSVSTSLPIVDLFAPQSIAHVCKFGR
jgi:hypothetical protein